MEWTDCLLRTGNIFILFLDCLARQIILCFSCVDFVIVYRPFTIFPVKRCKNSQVYFRFSSLCSVSWTQWFLSHVEKYQTASGRNKFIPVQSLHLRLWWNITPLCLKIKQKCLQLAGHCYRADKEIFPSLIFCMVPSGQSALLKWLLGIQDLIPRTWVQGGHLVVFRKKYPWMSHPLHWSKDDDDIYVIKTMPPCIVEDVLRSTKTWNDLKPPKTT